MGSWSLCFETFFRTNVALPSNFDEIEDIGFLSRTRYAEFRDSVQAELLRPLWDSIRVGKTTPYAPGMTCAKSEIGKLSWYGDRGARTGARPHRGSQTSGVESSRNTGRPRGRHGETER